jgi:hypothetical protein
MTRKLDAEDRKQQRLRRLGTQNPICVGCGETDPTVLEMHHVAGRKNSEDLSIVCANCHRKLSNAQRDHVPPGPRPPAGHLAVIGHYLLGIADLFALIVEALRSFGAWLIGEAREAHA